MASSLSRPGLENGVQAQVWRPEDITTPIPDRTDVRGIYRPEILETIEKRIKELDLDLRELSADIHGSTRLYHEFLFHSNMTFQIILNWDLKNS
jgi:hypothetical protein